MPGCPIEIDAESTIVDLDPEMIRAVMLNLLMNACQASGETPVEVHAAARDDCYEMTILDRGPGIPAQVREHLFEPFMTSRPGGTGLGLAIARRLTQLNGGTLTLGDRPGGGTAAVVQLPRLTDAAPPVRTRQQS